MEPVHGRGNKPEDFNKVNEALFPKGTDMLDIYEWTTDMNGMAHVAGAFLTRV